MNIESEIQENVDLLNGYNLAVNYSGLVTMVDFNAANALHMNVPITYENASELNLRYKGVLTLSNETPEIQVRFMHGEKIRPYVSSDTDLADMPVMMAMYLNYMGLSDNRVVCSASVVTGIHGYQENFLDDLESGNPYQRSFRAFSIDPCQHKAGKRDERTLARLIESFELSNEQGRHNKSVLEIMQRMQATAQTGRSVTTDRDFWILIPVEDEVIDIIAREE